MKRLYVGNLSWGTNDQGLREAFEPFGTVHSARVILDRDTQRSRGFGFVEMDDAEAEAAISGMDGRDLDGRTLRVNEAMPPGERAGGGDRGGYGGDRGGYRDQGGRGGSGGGGRRDRRY